MRASSRIVLVTIVALVAPPSAAGLAAPAGAAPGCTPVDLQYVTVDVPGAEVTQVRDLNAAGKVVGRSGTLASPSGSDPMAGFVYDRTTEVFTPVVAPGVHSTYPESINDAGTVAGFAGRFNQSGGVLEPTKGFLWRPGPNGPKVEAVAYPGLGTTFGFKHNDSDTVVGYALDGAAQPHSFTATAGDFEDIVVDGATATYATAIDDTGRIAGGAGFTDGGRSFIRVDGVDTFPTVDCGSLSINDLNAVGDYAGVVTEPNGAVHGIVVSDGSAQLVDFPGASDTRVFGLDETGQVAGTYQLPGDPHVHGFVAVHQATPVADLALAVVDSPDAAVTNQPVTEVWTVTNQGPDTVAGAVLFLSNGAATSMSPECEPKETEIRCDLERDRERRQRERHHRPHVPSDRDVHGHRRCQQQRGRPGHHEQPRSSDHHRGQALDVLHADGQPAAGFGRRVCLGSGDQLWVRRVRARQRRLHGAVPGGQHGDVVGARDD